MWKLRFTAALLALCLALDLLAGCTGANSRTVITPANAGTGQEKLAEDSAAEEQSSAAPTVQNQPAVQAADAQNTARERQPAADFAVTVAQRNSEIFTALATAAQLQAAAEPVYARSDDAVPWGLSAQTTDPVFLDSIYTHALDTTACISVAGEGQLFAVLGTQSLLLLGPEGLWQALRWTDYASAGARPIQVLLEGAVLAVVLAAGEQSEAAYHRTEVLFFDVADPAAPTLTHSLALDGDLSQALLEDGQLTLITSWDPDPKLLRLPCRYDPQGTRSIPARQVLLPAELTLCRFTICACFSASSGDCRGWFAAAGDVLQTVLLSADTAVVLWRDNPRDLEFWQESVYQVTQTTQYIRTGAAQLTRVNYTWRLGGASSVDGALELAQAVEDGLCLVTADQRRSDTLYEDTDYGFTAQRSQTGSVCHLLTVLGSDLSLLGQQTLAEDMEVQLLGLWDTTLYFVTSDGLLRAAGISDPWLLYIAPLAEVSGFTQLLVLQEGAVAGLQPSADGLELVLLNVSNPSRITRKYLPEPLPPDAEFVPAQAQESTWLLALQDQSALRLCLASNSFGLTLLQTLDPQTLGQPLTLTVSGGYACLVGSLGVQLCQAADGAALPPLSIPLT